MPSQKPLSKLCKPNLLVTKAPKMVKYSYQLINFKQNDRILQVYKNCILHMHIMYVCINVCVCVCCLVHMYLLLSICSPLSHSLYLFVPPADLYLYSQTICNPSSINIHQFRVLLFMYE